MAGAAGFKKLLPFLHYLTNYRLTFFTKFSNSYTSILHYFKIAIQRCNVLCFNVSTLGGDSVRYPGAFIVRSR